MQFTRVFISEGSDALKAALGRFHEAFLALGRIVRFRYALFDICIKVIIKHCSSKP